MRSFTRFPSSLTVQSLLLLAAASVVSAGPYPKDDLHDLGFSYLMARGCQTYCGSDNQYCCGSGETCTTVNGNQATCLAVGGGNGHFTTTWTETRTYTSTGYTQWAPVPEPTAGVDCVPQNSQQEACGAICCAGWQTCAFKGQCSSKPGYFPPSTVVVTSNGVVTTQYSAPYRVTGTTTITSAGVISTGTRATATATTTGDEAIGAGPSGTNNGGLSPGAIAGIVIGSLAGVALLLLLCFCCIARGLWVALFGKKKDNGSVREEVVEERFSKHGGSRVPSAYSRRERHTGWFGGRGDGGTSSVSERREKKKSGAKWLGIGALAATLLALLNLKKDKRPASHKTPSRYSDSYYSYSDYTSPTGSSTSDGRTRTQVSRESRGTRASRYSRQPKRP
ncbi:hypothetical protein PT974_11504 [Cladobotryum mycophilum]|uniref:Glycophorin A domain-containing protein n=1 Tax=Cladobotryum mycophilum TaxID=491253 RepID=A0ABR0S6A2_9HYPO